jgi:hypothetical protein
MTVETDALRQGHRDALARVLDDEFGGDRRAFLLIDQFVHAADYDRGFAVLLMEVARGRQFDSWELRRLAALVLQRHLLKLDVDDTSEFRFVLEQLGIRTDVGSKTQLPASVLKEGYSSTDLKRFIREFRQRLERPRFKVNPARHNVSNAGLLRAFLYHSLQDCKLALGRYLFSPHEVVARIKEQTLVAGGMSVVTDSSVVAHDVQRTVSELPDFEASILAELRSGLQTFWVADDTTSRVNSLVEYPLGTVVLVVKPPGSQIEFELKRAGRRGVHPLSAVMERNGSPVPPSHRLDGGSMVSALQWDMTKTSLFDEIYRFVHGEAAPISRIVHLTSKYEVPLRGGAHTTIDYLTDPSVYGEGFDALRRAMAEIVDAFRRERGTSSPPIPGDLGLTVDFIALIGPAQAIISGSSSFRLDLVAKYLSADGPDQYFRRGLEIEPTVQDAKQLADDVLDEALGVYYPPEVTYQDHVQYVASALAVPRNRARANAVYVSLLRQVGTMWGTLLALRGYSFGESFVSRNVGLRTTWRQGAWHVNLIFQDHDNLVLPDNSQSEFWPMTAFPHMALDGSYINGRDGVENCEWELDSLRRIYRVGDELRETGRKRLRTAIKTAYAKTQNAMESDPRVKSRFHERFIERLRDWDTVARAYLARKKASTHDWKLAVERLLRKRGYDESLIADHCRALDERGDFVETYSFLYGTRSPAPRTPFRSRDGVPSSRGHSRSRSASRSKRS